MIQDLANSAMTTSTSMVMLALTLGAAIAWNNAVKAVVKRAYASTAGHLKLEGVNALVLYAVVMTGLVVVAGRALNAPAVPVSAALAGM